jgi:Rrf2 family protein
MRLSHQVHYAICGVFDLAYNGNGEPVQVRIIGERQQIPTRYLEQIFQRLRKADLIQGKRGPGGGYSLARPAGEITLLDIVEAVEGSIEDTLDFAQDGEPNHANRPNFIWREIAHGFADLLAQTSIESMCRDAALKAVARPSIQDFTYEI